LVKAGPLSVITINRGRARWLEVGHVLALYSLGGTVGYVEAEAGMHIQAPG